MGLRQEANSAWTAAGGSTVTSNSLGSACLAASTMVVWVLWSNNGSTLPTSVVDSASQAYTHQGAVVFDNNTGLNLACYVLQNNASTTALNVTATWASAQTYTAIWIAEINTAPASSYQTFGGQSQDAPGTGATAISSGNVTPTSQPAILYSMCADAAGGAVCVPAGSLTLGSHGWLLTGNTTTSGNSGYQLLSSTLNVAAQYGNSTDGGSASFLTGAVVISQLAGNTATIAWVS